MPHPNVDPSLSREVEQQSLNLAELIPGQVVRLELAEGLDHERSLSLDAKLLVTPPEGECPEFEVIGSEISPETIAANAKLGLPNPDFVGQSFLVRGGCSRNPGNHPTMVHVNHIDINRDLWLAFELPETAKARSMEYFPFVRRFSLIAE